MNRTPKTAWQGLSPTRMKKTVLSTTPTKKALTQMKPPQPVYPTVVKVKDKLFVIPQLQDVVSKLNLNSFQPFPFEEIEGGKEKMNGIYKKMKNKQEARCLVHGELVNLFCEKDKSMVCVDCVYKDQKHKGHTIIPLDKVIKTLQLEAIRITEKVQAVIDKLLQWQQKVAECLSDVSDTYLSISNHMSLLFKGMVNEIHRAEAQFSKIILQNYTRSTNIVKKYGDTIEKARGAFHGQLRSVVELEEVNKLAFLRELNEEVGVCEKLIKKTHQTIGALGVWKEIDVALERLDQKKRKEEESNKQKQIIVTQF